MLMGVVMSENGFTGINRTWKEAIDHRENVCRRDGQG